MNRVVLAVVLLSLMMLSGCMSYSEEMRLNPDSSGTMSFVMGIFDPDLSWDMEEMEDWEIEEANEPTLTHNLDGIPGITVVSTETYKEDDFHWSEVVVEFESLDVLSQELGEQIGKMLFILDDDGNRVFTREIIIRSANLEDVEEIAEVSQEMLEEFFSELFWEYAIKFPGKVLEANAPPENIDEATNTVKWSFSVLELMDPTPQVMWAKIAP